MTEERLKKANELLERIKEYKKKLIIGKCQFVLEIKTFH